MALEQTIITSNGIEIKNAYIKAQYVSVADKTQGLVTAAYYVTKTEKSAFQSQSFEFDYVLDGANPIAQGYQHLKTLPEFENAIDC